jgi:glycogen phosphorylase
MTNPETHPLVAYFCAEFGIESRLPWYAGGLGILAGDTLKQAADSGRPVVGIGLLYRGEGSIQQLSLEGLQIETDQNFEPVAAGLEHVYYEDMPLFIKVHLTEIDVWLRCWKKTLGPTVTLYLLDTDTDQNQLSERSITHLLYSGTEESVLKQQLILGIGGVKLLHNLGIHPDVYHVQEGRPAFLHWQLIRSYMDQHGLSYEEAKKMAIGKTVYTNHTLVGAGNPSYDANLLKRYAEYYAHKMGVGVDMLLAPGIEQEPDRFWVTRFALNTSRIASGVSQPHTALSQQSWPEYKWVNCTNGVHFGSWQAPEMKQVAEDPAKLWQTHLQLKKQTMEYIQRRTGYGYNPDHLVVTWSRRLAGYKRFDAIFQDVARLKAILHNVDRPVQLLLAGKAHRLDAAGKELLQTIIHLMGTELAGQALYIPNYDIDLAQMLTRGSDVWLNTPEMGREACGTSGMKAISNGVLNCTVADGWAAEVDWAGVGWTLDSSQINDSVYETFEHKVVPLFYDRDEQGVPKGWVKMMQASLQLAPRYSAERMLGEYFQKLYSV